MADNTNLADLDQQQNTQQQQQNNPSNTATTGSTTAGGRPRRILMMGPNDGGKTSMAKVIFENWEPARTQYQGKTGVPVREDIFLFGRKLFSFFDCGGQVAYFDDYLKDPYLFNDVAALVFVVDATLFFLSGPEDQMNSQTSSMDQQQSSNMARTWNPQTIRDVFSKIVKVLLEKSSDARVFILLNKMDKVYTSAAVSAKGEQVEALLVENAIRLQQAAVDAQASVIFARTNNQQQQQQHEQQTETSSETMSEVASTTSTSNINQPQQQSTANMSQQELDTAVPCFRTSIFNNTIIHAWSEIVVKLLEPSGAVTALTDWLDRIRKSSDGEILEACLLDSTTMLCIASSSSLTPSPLASEVGIRSKRQRLKGLGYVTVTHPHYAMVLQPCIVNRLQLLLVGDGFKTTPGVTQFNGDRFVESFYSKFVDDRMPPPWPREVVQVRQLLGTLS